VDPPVRIMPDKRNDQIKSSPNEENTSPPFVPKPTGEVRILNQAIYNQLFYQD
jgi:hypothetical protein